MKNIVRYLAAASLTIVFVAVQSMFVFAVTDIKTGELTVIGLSADAAKSAVKINGESSVTGRSVFSSNLIETTGDSSAIISAGKAGKIQLAANSQFVVSFDDNRIGGSLLAGQVTVLNAPEAVNVTVNGKTVKLNTGETADSSSSSGSASSAPTGGSGKSWLPWVFVIGGAAAALVIATSVGGGSDFQLGTTASVVSPNR